jgi:hypothetical protein
LHHTALPKQRIITRLSRFFSPKKIHKMEDCQAAIAKKGGTNDANGYRFLTVWLPF